jgi:hypothetical protein
MKKLTKDEQFEQVLIKRLAKKMLHPAIGHDPLTVLGAIAEMLNHIRRTETDDDDDGEQIPNSPNRRISAARKVKA